MDGAGVGTSFECEINDVARIDGSPPTSAERSAEPHGGELSDAWHGTAGTAVLTSRVDSPFLRFAFEPELEGKEFRDVTTSRMPRTGRAPAMLVAASLVLAAPLPFAGPAHAEDIRPVSEVSEEQIAGEAAVGDSGPATGQSSVDGPDPVDAVVVGCGDQGTHYRVFNRKNNIHIPTGIDFKSGPGGATKASVQHSLSTSLKVSMGAKFSWSGRPGRARP